MHIQNFMLDEIFQSYFSQIFENISLNDEGPKVSGSLTYGEMLYPSVKKVLSVIQCKSSDIFLDLGSGLGKLILQVFMQTEMQKIIGLEARRELSEQSSMAAHRLKEDFPFFWEQARALEIVTGDFLVQDWQKATIVYSCSTCFRPELLAAIGDRINIETSVSKVLSLRPLPTLTRLPLKAVFTVECSWDSALCYFYAFPGS